MADDQFFTQIRNDIIRSRDLTPHEKAVLNVLLSYSNCKEIYPGQGTIAEEANMSRVSVNKIVKSLVKRRYIKASCKVNRASLVYELTSRVVVNKVNTHCKGGLQKGVNYVDTSNIKRKKNIKRKEPSVEITDRKGGLRSIEESMKGTMTMLEKKIKERRG